MQRFLRTAAQLPALLQAFRKEAGLTQREVALRLGVTQQTYSALERNADTVGAARLLKLLSLLGVELTLSKPSPSPRPASPPARGRRTPIPVSPVGEAMGRRSRTRTLGLWMNGARVGTWCLSPNAPDTLHYDPAWVASAQGRPLSLSLPFLPGNAPHRGEKVHAYFENLLPDSKDIRERLARRFRTGSTDAFALLTEIGRDCVGALEILPEDQVSAGIAAIQAEPLNEAQVAQVLRNATTPQAMGEVTMKSSASPLPGPRKRPPCCGTKGGGACRAAARPPRTFSSCPWADRRHEAGHARLGRERVAVCTGSERLWPSGGQLPSDAVRRRQGLGGRAL
jgi:HipA-like protein